jgi:DNA-binding response OmpR family regulator
VSRDALEARILVIEDDEPIRVMLRQLLEGEGYTVTTAANGKVAFETIRREDFHLVITDILMPEKEGIETIFELRRDFPELKVIAISGGGRFEPQTYLELAGKIGADRTISKPFSPSLMLSVIGELLKDRPGSDARVAE